MEMHGNRRRQRLPGGATGFTLIEVLVAVIVLAIGVLGIISLQYASRHVSYAALQRSTATMLAEGLIERIRLNSGDPDNEGVLPAYIPAAGRTISLSDTSDLPSSPSNCESANCTPEQLAEYDLVQWWDEVIGTAELAGTTNTGGLVTPWVCLFNTNATGSTQKAAEMIVAVAWAGRNELPDVAATPANPINDAQNCGRNQADFPVSASDTSLRRVLVTRAFISQ